MRHRTDEWTAAELALARRLVGEGLSSEAVALAVGRTDAAVSVKAWRERWPRPSTTAPIGEGVECRMCQRPADLMAPWPVCEWCHVAVFMVRRLDAEQLPASKDVGAPMPPEVLAFLTCPPADALARRDAALESLKRPDGWRTPGSVVRTPSKALQDWAGEYRRTQPATAAHGFGVHR